MLFFLHLHASCMCVFIFGPIELRRVKFTLLGTCEFFWAPRCKCTVPDRDLNELEICQHNAFGGRDARKLRGTPSSASTATGFRLIFWLFVMVSFRGCWRSFLVIVAFLVSAGGAGGGGSTSRRADGYVLIVFLPLPRIDPKKGSKLLKYVEITLNCIEVLWTLGESDGERERERERLWTLWIASSKLHHRDSLKNGRMA